MRFERVAGYLAVVMLTQSVIRGQANVSQPATKMVTAVLGRSELPYEQHSKLARALGDRIAKEGNERVVVTGTLTKGRDVTALRMVRELPGSFRIEEAKAGGRVIAVFDGIATKNPNGTVQAGDEDLAETLAQDTAESFLYSLAERAPYRSLGGNFRTDDGTTLGYKGPYLEIFQVEVAASARATKEVRHKLFMFDSSDSLLRRVVYDVPLNAKESRRVEVFIDDWKSILGQKVPGKIVRREDGAEKWRFEVTEAAIGPKQRDGIF
jgi:hypothetical protein